MVSGWLLVWAVAAFVGLCVSYYKMMLDTEYGGVALDEGFLPWCCAVLAPLIWIAGAVVALSVIKALMRSGVLL